MGQIFYTLQDFTLHAKNWAYILMGTALVVYVCYWKFLCSRDEPFYDGEEH